MNKSAASLMPDPKETIQLETIDLSRLSQRDTTEVSKLLKTCEEHGFFYLKLAGGNDESAILQDWEHMLSFTKRYFDLPTDVKMLDHRNNDTTG